ncbi:oxidoreductase-like domain-containing protein [Paraburkholderia caffeinilytica]|uniref:oxidoreductase-like domain-containing protein n=1 Tax=Paraburkholderia caffeinilytica TaxID=1761016 RepID=UPI003DA16DCD
MPRATPQDDPQPVPPVQPDLDDCCHSGCNPCVFDLYDEALERYQSALAEWQARQSALKAPKARTARSVPARQSKPRTRR